MTEFYAFADRHPILVTVWLLIATFAFYYQPLTLVKITVRSGENSSGPKS